MSESGWRPIETIPLDTTVLLWVEHLTFGGVRFGKAYHDTVEVHVRPDGCNGDWTKDCRYWMPLPSPPEDQTS